MKNPLGVGLLSNQNIVVAENDGNRLQIFDSQGTFVRIIGAGQVKDPYHLFVDSDDHILVAAAGNNRIQVFYQNGDHIKTIGSGQNFDPRGICMDHEGRILVAEGVKGQRVSIFLNWCSCIVCGFLSFFLSFFLPFFEKKRRGVGVGEREEESSRFLSLHISFFIYFSSGQWATLLKNPCGWLLRLVRVVLCCLY